MLMFSTHATRIKYGHISVLQNCHMMQISMSRFEISISKL